MPSASEFGAAARVRHPARRPEVGVFVVMEVRVYRDALALALEQDKRFRLAGTAPGIADAIAALRGLDSPPRVLLLDHAVAEGAVAVRAFEEAAPDMSVVAVAVGESGEDVIPWAEAGIAGFVSRDASLQDLLANVEAVAHGETVCSSRLAAVLVQRVAALADERRSASAPIAERIQIAAAGVEGRRADELSIRLLGTLGVQRGTVALPSFPTQRSAALFAYLVIHRDRLFHRDVLCGRFWGDSSDAQARKSLRTTLWRMRSVIEPDSAERGTLLRVEGDHVGFVARPRVWADVWELEEYVRLSEESPGDLDDATARRLGRVAQLYRGDFVEGHYDDWCLQPRERFRAGFLTALERLVRHHGDREEWLEAIACAQRVLDHDPLREHVHRALMVSYHAMGDRPSAVRQYHACAQVLRKELAIEPMEETRLLYERMRA